MTARRSSARIVGLVAKREFTTRVLTKSFLISSLVTLVLLVGGQIVLSMVQGGDDPTRIATVGDTTGFRPALEAAADSTGVEIALSTADDDQAARRAVQDGDVDVAVLLSGDGAVTAVSLEEPDGDTRALVDIAARQLALDRALAQQDVDADRLADDIADTSLTVDVLDPADPDQGQRVIISYAAVIVLFFTIYLYGLYVAMGVVEEKSSRVVELLLATIKPLELLVGKIIGIGAVGFAQIAVLGAAAVTTGILTDLITIGGTAVSVFAWSIVWYVLGFAFFAALYAGLGALVSRQEDVNSVTAPLTIAAFAAYFAGQFALFDPNAPLVQVLAWIPPFSATVMPMLVASGDATVLQMIVTVLVSLVAIAVAAVFAARVYRNSILHLGGRQSLRAVLSQSR